MISLLKTIVYYILLSGTKSTKSIQENKKIKLTNGTSLLSAFLLLVSIIWLDAIEIPSEILKYLLPPVISLFLLFLISRFISTEISKFALIILINFTILLGGLISDNTSRLQEVLSNWVFSTSGLLLIVFDIKEWGKILLGCMIILTFHLLIIPIDNLLVSNYSPESIDNQLFVSVSFILSMSLLIGAIYYSQSSDLKIYKELVKNLQTNNEILRAQDEEIRQSYNEVIATKEQIFLALENVSESKGHLEVAMRIAKMGSFHYYFKDDKSVWSEELKSLFDLEGEERQFEAYTMFEFIHPEDKEKVQFELQKAKTHLNDYALTYRVLTQRGNIKTFLSAGYVFKDAQNNRLGIRGIVQDITDYKNIESELIEANRELENFIYRAYHDIKGPLATIKGICYIASLATSEEMSVHYIRLLKKHTYHLETILSKLLIINEIKNLIPSSEPMNAIKLVDEAIVAIKNIDGFKKIIVHQDINLSDQISMDKIFFKIILQYLLENSIEFKTENSPWIKINIFTSEKGRLLNINVSDNGIGIPEEFYEKIFERYFRVSEKSKGTGLGLYIVKKSADKLNASIVVRSLPYIETTFSVQIPLIMI